MIVFDLFFFSMFACDSQNRGPRNFIVKFAKWWGFERKKHLPPDIGASSASQIEKLHLKTSFR